MCCTCEQQPNGLDELASMKLAAGISVLFLCRPPARRSAMFFSFSVCLFSDRQAFVFVPFFLARVLLHVERVFAGNGKRAGPEHFGARWLQIPHPPSLLLRVRPAGHSEPLNFRCIFVEPAITCLREWLGPAHAFSRFLAVFAGISRQGRALGFERENTISRARAIGQCEGRVPLYLFSFMNFRGLTIRIGSITSPDD